MGLKTIGLLGGMSWESTQLYYQLINTRINERLGGLHSARLILFSVDFEPIEALQQAGDWDGCGQILAQAARSLEAAGADFLVICTNTMHIVAPQIQAAVDLPLLHIADVTAEQIQAAGLDTIGLLGTNFTMEQAFYKGRLEQVYGLRVLTPGPQERQLVHRVIYDELCQGLVRPASRARYLEVIAALADRGAQGVILGCTEISMLVSQEDTPVPLFCTTTIHAQAAVDYALKSEKSQPG